MLSSSNFRARLAQNLIANLLKLTNHNLLEASLTCYKARYPVAKYARMEHKAP